MICVTKSKQQKCQIPPPNKNSVGLVKMYRAIVKRAAKFNHPPSQGNIDDNINLHRSPQRWIEQQERSLSYPNRRTEDWNDDHHTADVRATNVSHQTSHFGEYRPRSSENDGDRDEGRSRRKFSQEGYGNRADCSDSRRQPRDWQKGAAHERNRLNPAQAANRVDVSQLELRCENPGAQDQFGRSRFYPSKELKDLESSRPSTASASRNEDLVRPSLVESSRKDFKTKVSSQADRPGTNPLVDVPLKSARDYPAASGGRGKPSKPKAAVDPAPPSVSGARGSPFQPRFRNEGRSRWEAK